MPSDVIQFLNRLAHSQKARKGLRFQVRDNSDVPDSETPDMITAGVVGDNNNVVNDNVSDDSDED